MTLLNRMEVFQWETQAPNHPFYLSSHNSQKENPRSDSRDTLQKVCISLHRGPRPSSKHQSKTSFGSIGMWSTYGMAARCLKTCRLTRIPTSLGTIVLNGRSSIAVMRALWSRSPRRARQTVSVGRGCIKARKSSAQRIRLRLRIVQPSGKTNCIWE